MIKINNREKIDWYEGITVADVFEVMGYEYSLISVFVNEEYIPEEEYQTKLIPDEATVFIIHLAHGG